MYIYIPFCVLTAVLLLGTVRPQTHTSVNTDDTHKVPSFELEMRTNTLELIEKRATYALPLPHKEHA